MFLCVSKINSLQQIVSARFFRLAGRRTMPATAALSKCVWFNIDAANIAIFSPINSMQICSFHKKKYHINKKTYTINAKGVQLQRNRGPLTSQLCPFGVASVAIWRCKCGHFVRREGGYATDNLWKLAKKKRCRQAAPRIKVLTLHGKKNKSKVW